MKSEEKRKKKSLRNFFFFFFFLISLSLFRKPYIKILFLSSTFYILWVRFWDGFSSLITKPIPPFYFCNHLPIYKKFIFPLLCCVNSCFILLVIVYFMFVSNPYFNAFNIVVGYYIYVVHPRWILDHLLGHDWEVR